MRTEVFDFKGADGQRLSGLLDLPGALAWLNGRTVVKATATKTSPASKPSSKKRTKSDPRVHRKEPFSVHRSSALRAAAIVVPASVNINAIIKNPNGGRVFIAHT